MRTRPARLPRPRRGFTMLEMLTVVGIIVLLIAILLPVVSRVRSQAANPLRRKRLPAYLDPAPRQMMPDKPWSANGKTSAGDSVVPEFMDRYQVSMPILYMRANIGVPGVVPGWPSGTQVADAQYVPG